MEVTKQINPPQTDFCDDSQLFSIDLCDNARSFLTLFSIGGGGGGGDYGPPVGISYAVSKRFAVRR